MKEADIQNAFAGWLRKTGVLFVQPRHDQKSTIKVGWPDFSCFLAGGRTVFIETKRPGEKPRPEQAACHADLTRAGYEVYVCDSVEACIHRLLDKPEPREVKLASVEEVIFGHGVFEVRGNGLHPVRAATDADKRTLRKL